MVNGGGELCTCNSESPGIDGIGEKYGTGGTWPLSEYDCVDVYHG